MATVVGCVLPRSVVLTDGAAAETSVLSAVFRIGGLGSGYRFLGAIDDVAPDVRKSAGRESDGLGIRDWLSLVCYELFVVVVDVQIGEVETCGM